MDMGKTNNLRMFWIWIAVLNIVEIRSCQPGHWYGERIPPKTLVPFVRNQHIPNMSELTIGASGPAEGRITRGSERFKKLVVNYNTLIFFKNEEGTDADRRMTKRCKDRLDTLALLVKNQWPSVKLRVTEAWDEDGVHAEGSLHYEGRAVDITTDDVDHEKYGILARLAVEAGFDWVFYGSANHVHASVFADDSDTAIYGGCFPAHATVTTTNGVDKAISDLNVGERVWGVDRVTGEPRKSDIIMMMHSDNNVEADFLEIVVHSGTSKLSIELTPNHLIYVHSTKTEFTRWRHGAKAIFASDVVLGDIIYVKSNGSMHSTHLELATVMSVRKVRQRGLFAPLTSDGTLLINGVAASCYAVFENEPISHALFSPVRFLWEFGMNSAGRESDQHGVHWYPKSIFDLTRKFLPTNLLRTT